MRIKKYSSESIRENPHGIDSRLLYDHDAAQIVHMTLHPGERLKPHSTPVDVAFYVLEGTPTIHIGEESIPQDKDTLIESPANIVHNISNEGGEVARILVIKAPKPQHKSKIV